MSDRESRLIRRNMIREQENSVAQENFSELRAARERMDRDRESLRREILSTESMQERVQNRVSSSHIRIEEDREYLRRAMVSTEILAHSERVQDYRSSVCSNRSNYAGYRYC